MLSQPDSSVKFSHLPNMINMRLRLPGTKGVCRYILWCVAGLRLNLKWVWPERLRGPG